MNEDHKDKRRFEGGAMKALAIFGLIVVLGLGLWASVALVRVMPNAFSSISRGLSAAAVSLSSIFVPAEKMEVTIDSATVNSGSAATISWKHSGKKEDNSSYTISFECRDGVTIDRAKANGTYAGIACANATTTIENASDKGSLRLVFQSTKNRYVDVPLTISLVKSNGDKVSDTVLVTVVNNAIADSKTTTGGNSGNTNNGSHGTTAGATTTTVRQIPTGSNTAGTSNPNGQADLAVTFLDFGYIDSATQAFVSSTSPRVSEKLAVKFSIENKGTKATPDTWQFSAVLPTMPSYIFQSDAQRSLMPGDRIEYTLSFDEAIQDQNTLPITVNVDTTNRVNERNKDNNLVTKSFTVSKVK